MKNKLKASVCFLLIFALVFSFSACKNKHGKNTEETTNIHHISDDDEQYQSEGNGFSVVLGQVTLSDFASRLAEGAYSFTFSLEDFKLSKAENGEKYDTYALFLYSEGIQLFALKLSVDPQTQYVKYCNIGGFGIGNTKDATVNTSRKALYKQVVISAVRALTGKSTKKALDVYTAFDLNDNAKFIATDVIEQKIDGCTYSYSSATLVNSFTITLP